MAKNCIRNCPEMRRLAREADKSLRDRRGLVNDILKAVRRGDVSALMRKLNIVMRVRDAVVDGRAVRSYYRCMHLVEESYDCTGPTPECPLMPMKQE
jgi:hypothetical protein